MKKYAMYVVVICLLCSILIGAFVFRLGRNTGVYMAVDVPKSQSTKMIKNVQYGFQITETNFSSRAPYQWNVQGEGGQIFSKFGKRKIERSTYEEMTPYNCELTLLYDKKTMPKDKAHRKSIDGPANSFYEATVSSLTYRFKLHKTYKEKQGIDTTVTIPMGKKGMLVTYHDDSSDVSPDYSAFVGSAQQRLGNLVSTYIESGIIKIGKDFYTHINALNFGLPPEMIQIEKPIGGIYKIAENGEVKQIITTDMRKENVLVLNSYKDELIAVCEKEGKVSVRVYTADGKLKRQTPIHIDVSSLTYLQLQTQKDGVIVIPYQRIEDGYMMHFLVYDIEQGKLKQLDDIYSDMEYNVYDFLYQYDKKNHILYTLLQASENLYLVALNQKETLFHASIYGDFQEDRRIATIMQGLTAKSIYEVLLSPFLNTELRTVNNLYLNLKHDDN